MVTGAYYPETSGAGLQCRALIRACGDRAHFAVLTTALTELSRLREEMAKPQAGWLQWFRRPMLAAALTVMLGVGVGLFVTKNTGRTPVAVATPERGTAVGDLQDMEQNHDLYADYEVLDDLDVAQDEDTATP